MNDIYEFSTDKVNVFSLVLDCSGSMDSEADAMRDGLQMFKNSFKNFSEASSMSVAVNKFTAYYDRGNFKGIDSFNTRYYADGGTALYDAIVKGANQLLEYIKTLNEKTGAQIKATYIVFTDGESNSDQHYRHSDAKQAVERLNAAKVTTVFVAFGSSMHSSFGKDLGFIATIDVKDRKKLASFMGVELSKSCKEQSKSMKSLGSNFFSKAANSTKSEKYSQKTKQVLEDEDWLNDI